MKNNKIYNYSYFINIANNKFLWILGIFIDLLIFYKYVENFYIQELFYVNIKIFV